MRKAADFPEAAREIKELSLRERQERAIKRYLDVKEELDAAKRRVSRYETEMVNAQIGLIEPFLGKGAAAVGEVNVWFEETLYRVKSVESPGDCILEIIS